MNERAARTRRRLTRFFKPRAYVRFMAHVGRQWRGMTAIARNWPIWILRQLLLPVIPVHCWIHTRAGTRYYLGRDPVDDAIVKRVMSGYAGLYFPADARVPPGALIVDVGAHHGIYATEVLRRSAGARLIAIEPHPEARVYFERNLRANRLLDRVEYVQAGLSNRTGSGFLVLSSQSWRHSTVAPAGTSSERIPVSLVRLVDVLKGRHPFLIKLNAEGVEFEVIPDLLDHGIRPQWLILMIHPCGSAADLVARVSSAGYDIEPGDGLRHSSRLHCRLRETAGRPLSA